MRSSEVRLVSVARRGLWAAVMLGGAVIAAAEPPVDFNRDVLPVLQRACITCHSETLPQAGLALTSREGALRGGVSGPAIVEGDAAASLLVKRVAGVPGLVPMPMGLPPLTAAETTLLKQWIDEGARWPEPAGRTAAGVDFAADVQPIFRARCVRCHGAELSAASSGSTPGPAPCAAACPGQVVIPGDSRRQPARAEDHRASLQPSMPFEGPPLPADEIARITRLDRRRRARATDEEPAREEALGLPKPVRPEPPAVEGRGLGQEPHRPLRPAPGWSVKG